MTLGMFSAQTHFAMTAGFDGQVILQEPNDLFSPSGWTVFMGWETHHKEGQHRRGEKRSFRGWNWEKSREQCISTDHMSSHNVKNQLRQQDGKIWNSN